MNDSWRKQLIIKLDINYPVIIGYICTYQHNYGYHRLIKPAVIYRDGYKKWYNNHKLHNQNGPAVLSAKGYKEWWVDDVLVKVNEHE